MNRYGLLGHKLSHSQSKIIHEFFFNSNGVDANYDLIEIEEEEIKSKIDLIKSGYYKGFNVTVPYKEKVIQYLDILSDSAKEIGAVNTIYLKDGLLVGDNTDYLGFIEELNYLNIDLNDKTVYVLGSGGASKAICYALKKVNAKPIVVSRDNQKGITYNDLNNINHFAAIINTTPIGMYPNVDGVILNKDIIEKSDLCIDIICNPKQTKFLQYSKVGYNGIYMLIFQAIYAQRLWGFDLNFDVDTLYEML